MLAVSYSLLSVDWAKRHLKGALEEVWGRRKKVQVLSKHWFPCEVSSSWTVRVAGAVWVVGKSPVMWLKERVGQKTKLWWCLAPYQPYPVLFRALTSSKALSVLLGGCWSYWLGVYLPLNMWLSGCHGVHLKPYQTHTPMTASLGCLG